MRAETRRRDPSLNRCNNSFGLLKAALKSSDETSKSADKSEMSDADRWQTLPFWGSFHWENVGIEVQEELHHCFCLQVAVPGAVTEAIVSWIRPGQAQCTILGQKTSSLKLKHVKTNGWAIFLPIQHKVDPTSMITIWLFNIAMENPF